MAQLPFLNNIHFYGNKTLLKGRIKTLKNVLIKIISDHHFRLSQIEINLISDEELLKINIESLNHNYYTDIITFDYTEQGNISGDLYISIDRVKENARDYKTSSQNELLRVIIHGVLHLAGYKDKTKVDKAEMTKMENKYLMLFEMFHGEQK
jgi:probable rRNA maturation factor